MKDGLLNNSGNSILEMVVFLPLALLFLFVATDAGLSFVEKAGVRDAIRSGLQAKDIFARGLKPITSSLDGVLEVDQSAIERISNHLVDEITKNISLTKRELVDGSDTAFGVDVTAIVINIDPLSGALRAGTQYTTFNTARRPEQGVLHSSANILGYPYISQAQFIESELSKGGSGVVNSFATPLGVSHNSERPSDSGMRYAPHSLVYYVEVRAIANGINPNYTRGILGHLYGMQEQQLQSYRFRR